MNRFASTAIASGLALALTAGATVPSLADSHHHRRHHPIVRHHDNSAAIGAGIFAGFLGLMAGAALANSGSQGPVVVQQAPDWRWRAHVRACFRAYGRDYSPRTDTYIDYYGYERQCTL